ncbi:MAG: DUF4832 domain-containing protein [Asticcacaulis sp.]
MFKVKRAPFWALSGIMVVNLAACGGGSGAANSSPSTPAPVPPVPAPVTTTSATFSATDAEFSNPERGFYRAASTDLDALGSRAVSDAYNSGFRLIYARINLEPYRESDLPEAFLDKLETAFETARAGGVKLIVRATYNYPRGETDYHNAQDASLPQVKAHLTQLKPLLQDNADVIYVMQAGFIGAWGEWHTSSNNLTTPANRTEIKDALLDAVPASRFIQFRYPPYIMDWTPTLPSLDTALSIGFRIGFHNDCFLASTTDVGTYSENATTRAKEQAYNAQLGDLAPFGGETCNPADAVSPTPRTTCDDIRTEGASYNLSYLNDSYYRPLFHNNWTSEGCMAEVRRKMGYRLGLVNASHALTATRGTSFSLTVTLNNTGWARLYNPRSVQLVLRDSTTGAVQRIEATTADPRRWLPQSETTQTLTVTLPADLATGTKEVWLALPDADDRLKNDPRYAVRLANADDAAKGQKWDATLGAFALGTTVEIR